MNNLVSINRKLPGGYLTRRGDDHIPEKVLLISGVIVSTLLQIFCAYVGLIPLLVSAGSTLAGAALGLAIYYKSPRRLTSLNVRTLPQSPMNRETALKKAA